MTVYKATHPMSGEKKTAIFLPFYEGGGLFANDAYKATHPLEELTLSKIFLNFRHTWFSIIEADFVPKND